MKLGICIIVSILLSGCSSLFPIKVTDPRTGIEYTVPARLQHVPGIKQLAEACATKAGRVVHRTVEVDGYFSHGTTFCDKACWSSFAQSPYQYVEFGITKIDSWNFLKKKGLWRISKQDLDDARCEAKPTSYVKRISDRDGWPMDFCLAFEEIEFPKSQFETASSAKKIGQEIDYVESILVSRSSVRDRSTKEELGYSVYPTLFLDKDFRMEKKSFGCSSLGIRPPGFGTGRFLVYDVLK